MAFLEQYRAGLEKAINEPGIINDLLGKAEQKTGVKRIYIALGMYVTTLTFRGQQVNFFNSQGL